MDIVFPGIFGFLPRQEGRGNYVKYFLVQVGVRGIDDKNTETFCKTVRRVRYLLILKRIHLILFVRKQKKNKKRFVKMGWSVDDQMACNDF